MKRVLMGVLAAALAGCGGGPVSPAAPPAASSATSARAGTPAGGLNPAVTPDTIGQTICRPNWTASIRPTLPTRAGFQHDHFIPLSLGGAPTDGANLWYVPEAKARTADKVESLLHRLVCAREMSLADAQWLIGEVKRRG